MIKILYSLSIASQGVSGIPKDSRRLGKILAESDLFNVDYLLIPRETNLFKIWQKNSIFKEARLISSITSNASFSAMHLQMGTLLKALISPKKRPLKRASKIHETQVQNFFWPELGPILRNERRYFFVPNLDLRSIYLRAKLKSPFVFKSEHQVYIQQHIDPIYPNKKTKFVVRIHDILPITHPQFFSPRSISIFTIGLKSLLKNQSITWVFDTEHQRLQFNDVFGQKHKTEVIGCAIPSIASKKHKHKKKQQFLVVNTLEPRKQTLKVIESFLSAQVQGLIPKGYKLIIVGNRGWMQDGLFEKLSTGGFGTTVVHKAYVSEFDLLELYRSSKFIVSASLAEGFGLPPIEGALAGCIPIVSDIDAHRETLGEFAVFFDPFLESLASVFGRAVEQEARHSKNLSRLKLKLEADFGEQAIEAKWRKLIEKIVSE